MDETMRRLKALYEALDNHEHELIDEFHGYIVKADDEVDFIMKGYEQFEKAKEKIAPCEMLLRFLCDIIHEYDAEEIFSRFKSGVYTEPRPW